MFVFFGLSIFTNTSTWAGYDTRSIFKRSLTGLNSEFSFSYTSCLPKTEELSLSYYLPIAGGRIIGFIPFPRVLVLYEMQSVSSTIWTRVTVSISYDDKYGLSLLAAFWRSVGVHPRLVAFNFTWFLVRKLDWFGLVWFLCLMAYQLFLGYLMPKPFS